MSPGISDSISPVGCGVSRLSLDNTLQTLYQVQPRRVLLAKQAQKYNSHPTSSGYLLVGSCQVLLQNTKQLLHAARQQREEGGAPEAPARLLWRTWTHLVEQ